MFVVFHTKNNYFIICEHQFENMHYFYVSYLCVLFCVFLLFNLSGTDATEDKDYPIVIHSNSGSQGVLIDFESGCQVIQYKHRWSDKESDGIKYSDISFFQTSVTLLHKIIELCQRYEKQIISPSELILGLRDHTRWVYPGTKYCGTGNSSSNFDDLGEYTNTDKCCREHDLCDDYVLGHSCHPKNGLCNNTPLVRSNCSCDENFRQCLHTANEPISNRIGKLFFDVFGLKCFKRDYPIIKCTKYGGFLNLHCQHYLLNYTKKPMLQFFDSPRFIIRHQANKAVQNRPVKVKGFILEEDNFGVF